MANGLTVLVGSRNCERGDVAAREIGQQPELLLLDEPAASLDLKHRAQLVSTLRRLRDECGLTALGVTHDPSAGTGLE